MPKARRARGSGPAPALPLAEQILQDAAPRLRAREKRGPEEPDGDGGDGDGFVDARLSRRILEQARRQQEELEAEHGPGAPAAPRKRSAVLGPDPDSEDDEEWPSLEKAAAAAGRSGDYGGEVEVDPEDEKAIEMFMNKNPPLRCCPSTGVGSSPRRSKSSLPCPTGSRSSTSPSQRRGQRLPCTRTGVALGFLSLTRP
uniref:Uncharacterized protein n=1 Tax=Junco hyemalis TaxID=40217 RepID=A0A8C5NRX5_JUNHY